MFESKAYAKQDGTMLSVTKNAPQVDMVSTVTPIVWHASTEYVADMTEVVNMVVLKVLKARAVIH